MITAERAMMEIEARGISLRFTYNAFWHAYVKTVSAIALTPIGAVETLCNKLDGVESESFKWAA